MPHIVSLLYSYKDIGWRFLNSRGTKTALLALNIWPRPQHTASSVVFEQASDFFVAAIKIQIKVGKYWHSVLCAYETVQQQISRIFAQVPQCTLWLVDPRCKPILSLYSSRRQLRRISIYVPPLDANLYRWLSACTVYRANIYKIAPLPCSHSVLGSFHDSSGRDPCIQQYWDTSNNKITDVLFRADLKLPSFII